MLDWNPALYRRYEDERTRPAQELLARVPLTAATRAVDLGCGPGNSTELLVQRFPGADVLGIDNSEAMLASARQRLPQGSLRVGRHRHLGARVGQYGDGRGRPTSFMPTRPCNGCPITPR